MRHVTLFLLALATACGSVNGSKNPDATTSTTPDAGDFSIAVSPATLTVAIAGSGTATVTVDRTGTTGDVMLSTQNLPAGVTATFATNPISAGANTSDVTLAVAAGTAAGTSEITIVGTAGGTQHTATLSLTITTITVTGTVSGARSGVTVGLIGKPSVVSDASGNFSFTDVSPPYDLYTVAQGGSVVATVNTVIYYQGLTRPDPTVAAATVVFFVGILVPDTGTLTGTKSGTGDTTSPIALIWDSGGLATGLSGSTYTFTASWPPAATRAGTLYGLQWTTKTSGAPDTILGFGSTAATLTENVTNTVNITLAAVQTVALTGTVTAPAGFPNPSVTLTQQLGNTSHVMWSATTTGVAATIPVLAAGKSAFFATTAAGAATTSYAYPALNAATDLTFSMPAPSLLTAPVNAATNIDTSTAFQYSAPAMSVSEISINSTGATRVAYNVITAAATATIPSVPEAPLPSNEGFTWEVFGFGPLASTDAAATAIGLEGAFAGDFTGLQRFSTNSLTQSFTSKP